MNISQFFLLYNTIKFLRFEQIYFRIYYKLKRPKAILFEVDAQANSWIWTGPCLQRQSLWQDFKVIFLSCEGKIVDQSSWNDSAKDKLWIYNLHYFDDLNSLNYIERETLHIDFIDKWIAENPVDLLGNGWEAYPLSLRLVNWIKWFSKRNNVSHKYLSSIATQAHILSQRLEYHILGNHLFANGKALIFVGTYLQGNSADRLLEVGLKILDREIKEQFLDDGAHFELSPMYHQILLLDLLELIDLAKTTGNEKLKSRLSSMKDTARNGLSWLESMLHPDGNISFFNDAAFDIAPNPAKLFDYAHTLGVAWNENNKKLGTNETSGYSRVSFPNYTLIFDHANIGPDYLPGHAHADTLSFELSIGTERLFVNSGTSQYGVGPERLRQRKTLAHNTVSVKDLDSSEVWSGFRVARRAYAKLIKVIETNEFIQITACHDGYERLRPAVTHTRELNCTENQIVIEDSLSKEVHASFNLHLHPDVTVKEHKADSMELILENGIQVLLECSSTMDVMPSTWHPRFGETIINKKIISKFSSSNLSMKITIS